MPPGAANHVVEAKRTVNENITVQEIMPHMHLSGKAMDVWAKYPGGREEHVLSVPAYDFNWQYFYKFKVPLHVPKGTQFTAKAVFDNSAGNPNNPDPTKEIRFGLPTTDEMMFAFYIYTEDDEHLDKADLSYQAGGAGGN